MRTVPPSALIKVVRTFTVVVLPAPFGPSSEKTVPAQTLRSIPFLKRKWALLIYGLGFTLGRQDPAWM
jgi:hypothetical protein